MTSAEKKEYTKSNLLNTDSDENNSDNDEYFEKALIKKLKPNY